MIWLNSEPIQPSSLSFSLYLTFAHTLSVQKYVHSLANTQRQHDLSLTQIQMDTEVLAGGIEKHFQMKKIFDLVCAHTHTQHMRRREKKNTNARTHALCVLE